MSNEVLLVTRASRSSKIERRDQASPTFQNHFTLLDEGNSNAVQRQSTPELLLSQETDSELLCDAAAASAGCRSLRPVFLGRRSAYPGQLLAKHDIQHASAADLGLHQDHAGMFRDHFADDRGIGSKRMLAHPPQYLFGRISRYNGDHLAFISDIQSVEPKNFASSLDSFAHRDRFLNKSHA